MGMFILRYSAPQNKHTHKIKECLFCELRSQNKHSFILWEQDSLPVVLAGLVIKEQSGDSAGYPTGQCQQGNDDYGPATAVEHG
jgi:hypothetical protein